MAKPSVSIKSLNSIFAATPHTAKTTGPISCLWLSSRTTTPSIRLQDYPRSSLCAATIPSSILRSPLLPKFLAKKPTSGILLTFMRGFESKSPELKPSINNIPIVIMPQPPSILSVISYGYPRPTSLPPVHVPSCRPATLALFPSNASLVLLLSN